jgi:feruloyl esterase
MNPCAFAPPFTITLRVLVVSIVALSQACLFVVQSASAATCESLATFTPPDTTIVLAKSQPAATFTPPKPVDAPGTLDKLPAFCRVAVEIRPTKDSDIKFEVWMPESNWNGKFMGIGTGGWAGEIWYASIGDALRSGYAAASTDTGHEGKGNDASFALGHPEKVIDFGYRAVHEMTVKAKAIVAAYYGHAPRYSYWNGCSTGGKQGLKEAQSFPNDYDGIVAGAPANYWTHLVASGVWIAQATLRDQSSYIPREKYSLIHNAVLRGCDTIDGIKDGVLDDPTRCPFDAEALQCKTADDSKNCLSAAQVEAARKIYSGPRNPRTGEQIFPGLEAGSEREWEFWADGPEPRIDTSHFKYVVFKNPKWDLRSFNFDRDVSLADKLDNGIIAATDPNLKEFFAHGGKLLLYHGWSDGAIAPRNTINYYKSVVATIGGLEKAENSVRLFMEPGVGHCGGGDGPFAFDDIGTLEQWIEQGKVPDRIVAAHRPDDTGSAKPDRTRPLCPYPQVAQYKGSGSTDDASSFVCGKE